LNLNIFLVFVGVVHDILSLSYLYTLRHIPTFVDELESQHWLTDRALLGAEEWRAVWDFTGLPEKKDVLPS
jgi:hypothetical protein